VAKKKPAPKKQVAKKAKTAKKKVTRVVKPPQKVIPESILSDEAIERLEKLIRSEGLAETWEWGYGPDLTLEPHRWHAGVLHGYWLETPEDYKETKRMFDALRKKINALDIVKNVEQEPYDVDLDLSGTGPRRGELWAIVFSARVEYTHRNR